jgi:hypothetical protein
MMLRVRTKNKSTKHNFICINTSHRCTKTKNKALLRDIKIKHVVSRFTFTQIHRLQRLLSRGALGSPLCGARDGAPPPYGLRSTQRGAVPDRSAVPGSGAVPGKGAEADGRLGVDMGRAKAPPLPPNLPPARSPPSPSTRKVPNSAPPAPPPRAASSWALTSQVSSSRRSGTRSSVVVGTPNVREPRQHEMNVRIRGR